MTPHDALDRTLALLHEAALDDARWFDAVRQLSETCRTRGSLLVLVGGDTPAEMELFFLRALLNGRRRRDWEVRYVRDYFLQDPRVERVVRQPPGQLQHTPDLYTEEEKKYSPVYNVALPAVQAQNGLHVRQNGPGGTHVVWALADSLEEGWTSDQISLIEHLVPHVRRCVRIRQRLAAAGALGTSLVGLLDNARAGVIQLDRRGRIIAANDRALRFLREGDGLCEDEGRLCARLPAENAELSRLQARALPAFGARGHAGSMVVTRSFAPTPLVVHMNPVGRHRARSRGCLAAVALVTDPSGRDGIDPVGGAQDGLVGTEPAAAGFNWRRGSRRRWIAGPAAFQDEEGVDGR